MTNAPDDLACRELVELISDYLDDALAPEARARFEEHLRTCEMCTQVVEQFRTTVELVGTLSEEQLSAQERDRLLHLFRSWRRTG